MENLALFPLVKIRCEISESRIVIALPETKLCTMFIFSVCLAYMLFIEKHAVSQ